MQVSAKLRFFHLVHTKESNRNLVPRAFPFKVGGAGKEPCISRQAIEKRL